MSIGNGYSSSAFDFIARSIEEGDWTFEEAISALQSVAFNQAEILKETAEESVDATEVRDAQLGARALKKLSRKLFTIEEWWRKEAGF